MVEATPLSPRPAGLQAPGAEDEDYERYEQIVDFFCYQFSQECGTPSRLAEGLGMLPMIMGRPVRRTITSPTMAPARGGFTAPRISTNRHGFLTNGNYSLDSHGMAPHTSGATTTGKSQFLYRVDSDKAVLDAAAYADEAGLWVGNKAKVFVEDGPVGVIGRTGELTSWINIYRSRTGMVHGAPGSAP